MLLEYPRFHYYRIVPLHCVGISDVIHCYHADKVDPKVPLKLPDNWKPKATTTLKTTTSVDMINCYPTGTSTLAGIGMQVSAREIRDAG